MTENIDLSLVIPCYNEEQNIPLIVKRCLEIVPDNLRMEIVLVNNGSRDATGAAIQQAVKASSKSLFVYCEVAVNQGYGHGILSGLAMAKGNVLAWTHADMQTDPLDVIKGYELYALQQNEMAFVKGQRKGRSLGPAFFTGGMTLIASLALGQTLTDIGAQPKLFSRKFYKTYLAQNAPPDFSLDLYAMYYGARYGKIVTFPVYFLNRQFGEAKGGGSIRTRIKVTKRVLQFIFEMRRNLKEAKLL